MADRTGCALIGVGMVSGTYVAALAGLSDRVVLTGALGARDGSAAAFLKQHAGKLPADARAYRSVQEIADDRGVGFVILTTPPNARHEIVEALAQAGKPILMEKPVERTLHGAVGICEICEGASVPLGIVLQHRASAPARTLRDRLRGPEFGPLRMAEINVPWWRDQAYYDEPGRGTYARDGGGVLITQAIHPIDLALQFTGPVREVIALTATTGFHQMEVEDFVSAGLRFDNGAVGSLLATTASFPGQPEEVVLHYQHATARVQRGALRIDWQDGRTETLGATAASGAGADPMAFSSDLHRDIIADFDTCLRTGGTPIATGRSALAAHALIEALERSGRSGARETVESVHHG
jgi:predicted dehydrogenase